ncbi:MAG: CRISPR-associated endonuclease Cas2 [Candidatus Micrarchaeia archaeon]
MVYVIVVYDIAQERVNKVCTFLKQYLNWVQNSVFEGEITDANLERVKFGLKEIINEEEDSVLIYQTSNQKWLTKYVVGKEKVELSNIL